MSMQRRLALITIPLLLTIGCSGNKHKSSTIDSLKYKDYKFEQPEPTAIEHEQVMEKYRILLATPGSSAQQGEAMRRLADLGLELGEEYSLGEDQSRIAIGQQELDNAIALYVAYLEQYPRGGGNDLILYQLSKAYAIRGDTELALQTMDRLVREYPQTRYLDEVQFRRGEILFVYRDYEASEKAYGTVVKSFPDSVFYEKALYKYGWSLFKQEQYTQALDSYMTLLDRRQNQGNLSEDRLSADLGRADAEFLTDTLRVSSLAFSYLGGASGIQEYMANKGKRPYEALLYRSLGELYLKKERITDAAEVYLAYVERNPESHLAPQLHTDAIDAYLKGNFPKLVLSAKEEFVERYGVDSRYWQIQTEANREAIKPLLTRHISELATHYHAQARKTGKPSDYQIAAGYYETYLRSFPKDEKAPEINFLLAEALFDGRQYTRAVGAYEKTAYDYPSHKQSAEAGYAALLAYREIAKAPQSQADKQLWHQRRIESALRFSSMFPQDKRAPAVLTNASEALYAQKDYERANIAASRLLSDYPQGDPKLKRTALVVQGHSRFEMADYAGAQESYTTVLKQVPKQDKEYKGLSDRLAASIYKQGEQARDQGDKLLAASYFMQVGKAVPDSSLRATAQYDAATMYIQMDDWGAATRTLEDFRKRFPEEKKLQRGVTEKLAAAYTQTGDGAKAATELLALAALSTSVADKRNLTLQAAQTYDKAGETNRAVATYKDYVRAYPKPVAPAVEAQHYLAEYYRKSNSPQQWGYWLNEIVKTDSKAGRERSDRTIYLAADATLQLAKPHQTKYSQAKLTIPLKKSLKNKKKLMQNTITMYERAIKYQVADVTTAATYQIGEIYNDFARSLMDSQRPRGLNADELEMYDILLEEQAFPFEEKAIEIHVANIQRAREGIYDEWVKKSLEKLAELQPVRYAKTEKTDAYAKAAN